MSHHVVPALGTHHDTSQFDLGIHRVLERGPNLDLAVGIALNVVQVGQGRTLSAVCPTVHACEGLADRRRARLDFVASPDRRVQYVMNLLRSDLYRLVWSYPGVKVAALLGISSSALTRLCRRHAVPAPQRGDWRRREVGQIVIPQPLPPAPDSTLRFALTEELNRALSNLPSASEVPQRQPAALPDAGQSLGGGRDQERELGADGSQLSSPPSGPLSAGQEDVQIDVFSIPRLDTLATLSKEHQEREAIWKLIQDLEAKIENLPPPTAALLMLWLYRAKDLLRMAAPVDRVVEACRRASWRKSPPP